MQFRKWMPAAFESRFESKRWDNRLGINIEGRYTTAWNLFINLSDTLERLKTGKLEEYEIYNGETLLDTLDADELSFEYEMAETSDPYLFRYRGKRDDEYSDYSRRIRAYNFGRSVIQ